MRQTWRTETWGRKRQHKDAVCKIRKRKPTEKYTWRTKDQNIQVAFQTLSLTLNVHVVICKLNLCITVSKYLLQLWHWLSPKEQRREMLSKEWFSIQQHPSGMDSFQKCLLLVAKGNVHHTKQCQQQTSFFFFFLLSRPCYSLVGCIFINYEMQKSDLEQNVLYIAAQM